MVRETVRARARRGHLEASKSPTLDRDRLENAEALRPLRGVIRTGAVRGFGGALDDAQAPAAALAVRQGGPQTGAHRAGGSTRQGH